MRMCVRICSLAPYSSCMPFMHTAAVVTPRQHVRPGRRRVTVQHRTRSC